MTPTARPNYLMREALEVPVVGEPSLRNIIRESVRIFVVPKNRLFSSAIRTQLDMKILKPT